MKFLNYFCLVSCLGAISYMIGMDDPSQQPTKKQKSGEIQLVPIPKKKKIVSLKEAAILEVARALRAKEITTDAENFKVLPEEIQLLILKLSKYPNFEKMFQTIWTSLINEIKKVSENKNENIKRLTELIADAKT